MSSLLFLLSGAPFSVASLLDRPGYDEENLAMAKLLIALVALVALFYEASRESEGNPVSRRTKKWVAGALAVVGMISYFQFFQIGYKEFYHRWEFYHYYIGAKYYRNIGFEGIYTCTAVAESELPNGSAAPNDKPLQDIKTRKLRDLRVNLIVDSAEWVEHPEKCKVGFNKSDGTLDTEKWESFKKDVAFFRRVMWGNYWRDSQKDHGYNPPPVWGITGSLFANLHPASEVYCKLLSAIDVCLFAGMFGCIAWAFGWRVLCLAIVFWGTQDASPFYWTGGAFLRQDWLFYTIVSACMIRRKKYAVGAAMLTYGAMLRVFPMFFFFGWAVVAAAYIYKKIKTEKNVWAEGFLPGWRRITHPAHRQLGIGLLVAAPVLFGISCAVHGFKAWPDFMHHTIGTHGKTALTNNMGWKTIVAHSAEGRMQIAKDPRMQDPFQKWKDMRTNRATKDLKLVYRAGQIIMIGMFVYACWRLKNLWVVQALGCILAVSMVELTCYYYSFFIFGAMLSKGRRPIEFALIGAALLSEVCHRNFGFFDDRFTAMSVVFVVLAMFMTAMYMRRPWVASERARPLVPAE
ncbi:MAG: hypothetical protein EOO74_03980 [Myxococcales bacterium]|nr:MAG: hypothetical protein EOO74_03980 [Myxococcales bacterium]